MKKLQTLEHFCRGLKPSVLKVHTFKTFRIDFGALQSHCYTEKFLKISCWHNKLGKMTVQNFLLGHHSRWVASRSSQGIYWIGHITHDHLCMLQISIIYHSPQAWQTFHFSVLMVTTVPNNCTPHQCQIKMIKVFVFPFHMEKNCATADRKWSFPDSESKSTWILCFKQLIDSVLDSCVSNALTIWLRSVGGI